MTLICIDLRPAVRATVASALFLATAFAQGQTSSPPPLPTVPATTPSAPDAGAAASPAGSEAKSADANASAAKESAGTGVLAPLAWLGGCWQGTVNQREFSEQWLPYRGGMMIGAGQQVLKAATQDYEFMRLDARPDGGVYFTQFSGDRKEIAFKLESTTTDDKDTVFTFANTADAFPARLIYRRGTGGWLYETIEGQLNGADKKVIYPMRRISCETGEMIRK